MHVTNACNFRCDHCFVDFESPKRDLKLDVYQQLAADSPPLMWLDIGGGEPFLRKDLADIEKIWHGLEVPYLNLFAWLDGRREKPEIQHAKTFHPMMLAHPIDEEKDFQRIQPEEFRPNGNGMAFVFNSFLTVKTGACFHAQVTIFRQPFRMW